MKSVLTNYPFAWIISLSHCLNGQHFEQRNISFRHGAVSVNTYFLHGIHYFEFTYENVAIIMQTNVSLWWYFNEYDIGVVVNPPSCVETVDQWLDVDNT